MATLTIDSVRKQYGNVHVLKGIDLAIESGEFLILVGPSGCGKSTLMKVIAGLDPQTSGEVFIGERNVSHLPPKDRDIAMVFQSYALYPSMTVAQNIGFALEIAKMPKEQRQERIDSVAKLLQIEHLLDRKPGQLSGGQQQRVAIGRALAREPEVFLFDEPLSNLDAKLRVEMRTELKKLHQRLKTTIVYVTHDQIEAMTLADRIAIMKDGIVQQFGTPREVYEHPANKFVAGFIGSPSMNFLDCEVVYDAQGYGLVLYPREDEQVIVPLDQARYAAVLAQRVGEKVTLGLRPEHITHVRQHKLDEPLATVIQVDIVVVEPTGADTMILTTINGIDVTARVDPYQAGSAGETMPLMLDMDKAVLFDAQNDERL